MVWACKKKGKNKDIKKGIRIKFERRKTCGVTQNKMSFSCTRRCVTGQKELIRNT
jgi:hypothetical protein